MTQQTQDILDLAMKLSADERAELADRLLQSLHPQIEEAWAKEVKRRIDAVESGQTQLIPWEQVRAELYEQLHGRKNQAGSSRQG